MIKVYARLQVVDCETNKELQLRTTELLQFSSLLELKTQMVEGRHYKDSFDCTIEGEDYATICLKINAIQAFCFLKHIASRIEMEE